MPLLNIQYRTSVFMFNYILVDTSRKQGYKFGRTDMEKSFKNNTVLSLLIKTTIFFVYLQTVFITIYAEYITAHLA